MDFLLKHENQEQSPGRDPLPVPSDTALEILREYFARERERVQ